MMLIFIDQEKHIRVVRVTSEEGATTRTPLGRIQKKQLELPDELRATLSNEEVEQIEGVVAIYRRSAEVRAECYALDFAAITREVMDRFETDASVAERQLVMGALMESLRRLRRFQREGGAS
jgi:hypothetical protein